MTEGTLTGFDAITFIKRLLEAYAEAQGLEVTETEVREVISEEEKETA